jgi:Na+/serine symporter
MSSDRKAAVWIGVLYIIGTVGMVLSAVVTNAQFPVDLPEAKP